MSSESDPISDSAIAIVGRAGRFAGSPDVETLWSNFRDGIECISRYTDEELLEAGVDPALLKNPNYVKCGGFLPDVAQFDAGFFGFGPKDAAILDPQHRHFMECSWHALEDAAHTPGGFDGPIGVFAGCGMNSYFIYNLLTNAEIVESTGVFLLRHTGNDRDFLPTTLSYKLNLTGPSIAVQTACSTSLVAIHMACQSLLSGESDMTIAGGSTIEVPHKRGYLYREGEVHTPDGRTCSFDERGTGMVLTSGIGVVVLRRLADAIEDGDHIHAVIRGSAVNNDGSQKVGYLAPSVDGQAAVIAEALAVADVSSDEVSYVETHGTGTAVGDPIEVAALTQAFRHGSERNQYCGIGSSKPNVGHTDNAAGVVSLLKVVEAMKHRQLPPTINFNKPNPSIDFENSPFYVNASLKDWESAAPRIAGVSSLGVGGTNAHVVLQEAPERPASDPAKGLQILPFSAKSKAALEGNREALAAHFASSHEQNFADAAHTLQVGRDSFEHRAVVVCRDAADAAQALAENDPQRVFSSRAKNGQPSIVFMFPGGGVQHPNMGFELYQNEPVYRAAMDECFAAAAAHLDFDLKSTMYVGESPTDEHTEELARPSRSLPATFCTEYAMAQLWMSWGIEPDAMTGHSMGEYTAACIAGVMSLNDAISMVWLRTRLIESLEEPGRMMSVPLSEAELRELLWDDLDLSVINAPALCVVSGSPERIEAFDLHLREREIEGRVIRVKASAHSRLFDPILDEFRAGLQEIELHEPEIPFISNLSGDWASAEEVTQPDYWVRHLREPVRFADGLATLMAGADRIAIEVGPGQSMCAIARLQDDKARAAVPSLPQASDPTPTDLYARTALGRVWAAGGSVDWSVLRGDERRLRVPMPTYAFDRQHYWVEPGKIAVATESASELERIENLDDWFWRPVWRSAAGAPPDAADSRPNWLVFADTSGIASRLIDSLEKSGHAVTVVREGDAFYRLGDREFALSPEAGSEGYAELLRALAEADQLPDRIAHLWLLTTDESARPGSNFFHRNEERGFYSLLYLAQALGSEDVAHDIHIGVVTNGMQQVADEGLPYPEKSLVLGPVGVIPQEFPHVSCQTVDVQLPEVADRGAREAALLRMAKRLARDIHPERAGCHLAYREDERWMQTRDRVEAEDLGAADSRLREGGTYLVTGGLGGLGLLVAEHLARRVRAKLVLIGRKALPPRDEWEAWLTHHGSTDPTSAKLRRLLEIEALGSEIQVEAADIADFAAMRRVVESTVARFGAVHGVFHAAGVIDDGPIQAKTQASIDGVFASKVHGTLVLEQVLAERNIDLMVLFSSSSSVLTPAGQIDYAAASSFLNAFAQSRSQRKTPHVVTIDWGVWRDVGNAVSAYERLGGQNQGGRPAIHPLLDRRIVDTQEKVVFSTQFEGSEHWILDDHRTGDGTALIPGTGYLELARAAVNEIESCERLELRNVFFVAPLMVGDDETVEARISLTREKQGFSFEVESRLAGGSDWQLHAQGSALPGSAGELEQIELGEIAGRCDVVQEARDGERLRALHEDQLRFGPRWSVLRSMHFGTGEALANLELSSEFDQDLGSYLLHPALLDLATGFATPLIDGYRGEMLWAPMSYKRVAIAGALPQRIVSHVRASKPSHVDDEIAVFDVTISDEAGRVLVQVEEFTIRKLAPDAAFATARGAASKLGSGNDSGGEPARLSAAERLFRRSYELGITPDDGMQAMDRILSGRPLPQLFVSSMDLPDLIERFRIAGAEEEASHTQFERPELDSEYAEPRDEVEQTLAELWREVLGVDKVGIHDDFFELGGHSLIAVRLFAKIKKAWDLEYAISVLFQAPTIETCAELIRSDLGIELGQSQSESGPTRQRHKFLVPLQVGSDPDRPPFFLVAGMFGNVLNLRHLAMHLGQDQTVYALQAKGLMGDDDPHRRFEDAARDYLEEMRTVQPEGPYYVGGFSGGGVTAMEMAQQLRSAGESVGILVLLDSLPAFDMRPTTRQKLSIHLQKLQRHGPAHLSSWLRNQVKWRVEQLQKRREPVTRETSPAEFRSRQIELAFREALAHYQTPHYEGPAQLFRPAHDAHYPIGDGYLFNDSNRSIVNHDNRFGPHIAGGIEVHVVTGDHDSMVLEPHVRHMGATLRECLERAMVEHEPNTDGSEA